MVKLFKSKPLFCWVCEKELVDEKSIYSSWFSSMYF